MSVNSTISTYLECFEGTTDEEFSNNIIDSINKLGRSTFLNVLERGLICINHQNENDINITNKLKLLTKQFKLNKKNQKSRINIFVKVFNEDRICGLCSFLCINDQINIKKTCKAINKFIKKVDITNHEWIGFDHDVPLNKICLILKNVEPILFSKTFDKIKINGITEYNFEDYYKLMPDLVKYNLFERTVNDNPEEKKKIFYEEMSVWLFMISNLCKNNGIFVTPKVCPKHTLNVLIFHINKHLTEHNPSNDYKISKNYVPRSIIFQCYDGISATQNDIDFYLEKIEECFDSMKDLLNHKNIERLIIVRKYKILDDKLYHLFVERSVDVFGPAFNVDSKFVTLKKNNHHYTIYLKFTKQLICRYISRYHDEIDEYDSSCS